MKRNGFRLVSGGTDNHLMLVDVGARGLTGKDCQIALDEAGITVNKNTIPFETRSPFQASGIRLGTPAVTTRGMKEAEMAAIADMISEVLLDIKNLDAMRQSAPACARTDREIPLAVLSFHTTASYSVPGTQPASAPRAPFASPNPGRAAPSQTAAHPIPCRERREECFSPLLTDDVKSRCSFRPSGLNPKRGISGAHHAGELHRAIAEAKGERILPRNSIGTVGREAGLVKRPRNDPLKLDLAARLWRERTLPIANRRVRHQTSAFASSLNSPGAGSPIYIVSELTLASIGLETGP